MTAQMHSLQAFALARKPFEMLDLRPACHECVAAVPRAGTLAGRAKSDREVDVLFTRTIRRKLLLVLALVLSMLVALSISGISGLNSYRDVIRELDYGINRAPH